MAGQRRNIVDDVVVEEWHAALDGSCHAHLVLLHQQLQEIRLEIQAAHAIEPFAWRVVFTPKNSGVRIVAINQVWFREQRPLGTLRKDGKVFQEQIANAGTMGDEAALGESARLARQRINKLPETTAQSGWHRRPVRTPK